MTNEEKLHSYAKSGDVDELRKILRPRLFGLIKPVAVDTRKDDLTALITACMNDRRDAAELLMECGADVNASTKDGFTPLMACAKFDSPLIAAQLIERGAKVNAAKTGSDEGHSALFFAAWQGNLSVARLLLSKGAHVNAATPEGLTPLIMASHYGKSDIAELLISRGADVNAAKNGTDEGWTALTFAAWKGFYDIADQLLRNGANINQPNAKNWTPLLWAAREGNILTVETLLKHHAHVNHQSVEGWTALFLAAYNNSPKICRMLVEAGADPNLRDKENKTALSEAVEKNHDEIIAYLLEKGADSAGLTLPGKKAPASAPPTNPTETEQNGLPILTPADFSVQLQDSRTLGASGPGGSHFQNAVQSLNYQDDPQALIHFNDALKAGLDPLRRGYAHANLGAIMIRKKDMKQALEHFITVIREKEALYESVHDAAQYLTIIYSEMGRAAEAERLRQLAARTTAQLNTSLNPDVAAQIRQLTQTFKSQQPTTPQKPQKKAADHVTANLRPLGNKKRLAQCQGDDNYDAYFLMFRDQESAEKYFHTFTAYARKNPPPATVEVMAAFAAKTIYAEKYVFVYPNPRADERPPYQEWAREAILTCNETLRPHNSTDSKYIALSGIVTSVYQWDILLPAQFDPQSADGAEILSDPENGGFPALKIAGTDGVETPVKPNPNGPWLGVLFDLSQFDEALYGRAAMKLLIQLVGPRELAGTVIHGGDLPPDCRYYCLAIHTGSPEQAEKLETLLAAAVHEKLAAPETRFLRGADTPFSILPFQGFVDQKGIYAGS